MLENNLIAQKALLLLARNDKTTMEKNNQSKNKDKKIDFLDCWR